MASLGAMKYLDVPSSGSIADRTHSHNRAGQYTRNRRAPVQPIGTGRRAFIRSSFGAASTGWASLTNVQQEAWISFAADHPITDALGQTVILTGHQMFVAVGVNLLNIDQGLPTDPPADLDTPNVSAATAVFSIATGLSIDDYDGPADSQVCIGLSKPMGAGRRFNKTFWQPPGGLGHADADSAPVVVATATYTGEFGTLTAGQVVFVKLTPISADGWAGTPIILRVVVGA